MEPGGTLEERAEVSRKRLLNYARFRLGEDQLMYELGAKTRAPKVPTAGDWDIEYTDPDSSVNRFSAIRDSVMEERVENSRYYTRGSGSFGHSTNIAGNQSLGRVTSAIDLGGYDDGTAPPSTLDGGGSSIMMGSSAMGTAQDAVSTLVAHSSIVGQPAAALLRASGRNKRNSNKKAVARFLKKGPRHSYGVAKPHGHIPKKDKLVKQRPRLLPGVKKSHSASAPALLKVSKSTARIRELMDTLPYSRKPVKLDGVERIRRMRERGSAYAMQSRVHRRGVSDPKSTAWEGDPEATDIVGTKEPIFIPVELFDDPNCDPWPPGEWLTRGKKNDQGFVEAESRWYDLEGNWEWRLCNVLSYEKLSSRFQIAWSHNGKRKFVPRLNLRFLEEDEAKFDERYSAAQSRRDTAEAAARYKSAVEALLGEMDLPKVVVPSEIFIGIFARSNVDIEAKMPRPFVKSIAKLSEEVRVEYISIMNRLHAAAVVVAPVPGGPTDVAGLPDLPFESLAIRTLRHGGMNGWKRVCGLDFQKDDAGRSDEGGKEPSRDYDEAKGQIVKYLPAASPYVLETLQKIRDEVVHRVEAMEAVWGPGTVWKPLAAFNIAGFELLSDEKKETHKARFYFDEHSDVAIEGKCKGRFPSSLEDFVATQKEQIDLFKQAALPHVKKVLDELVFDEYSFACDSLSDKLAAYEAALQDQRTRRSAPKAVPPVLPEGIVEPKELTRMRRPNAHIKDIPPGMFANRESSIIASDIYRGPFRRALYILNHMFLDTLRNAVISGLENLVECLNQYNVTPIDPTIESLARSMATRRRKKKRKKAKKRLVIANKGRKVKSKRRSMKWNLASSKIRSKVKAGVPVVGGTVGVQLSTCVRHVSEVENIMKFQGFVARSTDVLTDAAAYLVNKMVEPLFKIKLTVSTDGKGLCQFTPPLTEFEKGIKRVVSHLATIGVDIEPVNIDILQPTTNPSPRDERGHFFSAVRSAVTPDEAAVLHRSRTLMALLRGNMAYLGSLVLAMQTFKEFFVLDMASYVDKFRGTIKESTRTAVLKAQLEKVDFLQGEADRIKGTLVDTLWLHAFEIDCKDFKNHLHGNARAMKNLLLRRIDSDMREHMRVLSKRFGTYYDSLAIWPKNIEEFDNLKSSLDAFQRMHKESEVAVSSLTEQLEGLENRFFGVTENDYDMYWHARGWPYRLQHAKDNVLASMRKFQKRFEEELRHQKRVFMEEIDRLGLDFRGIHEKGVAQWREAEAVCDEISLLEDRLDGAVEEAEMIRSREQILGWEHDVNFGNAIEMREGMKPFNELWSKVAMWERQMPEWMDGPFLSINSESATEFVRQCWRDMYRLQRVFDQHDKYTEPLKVADRLKGALEGFKQYLPIIKELRNPAMRARHWMDLSIELNTTIRVDNSLTLRRLLADNMLEHQEAIKDISKVASRELKIEDALADIEATWNISGVCPATPEQVSTPFYFRFVLLDEIGSYGISNISEVTAILDEQSIQVQELESSLYAKPFNENILRLKEMQASMQTILEDWSFVQECYVSLYPQYLSGLLAKIPGVPAEYQKIDEQWRNTMDVLRTKDVNFEPPAMRFIELVEIGEDVSESKKIGESIMDGMQKYFLHMRSVCPRLYLLSDKQCFQMLALSKNPSFFHPLMRVLFPGTKRFELATRVKIRQEMEEVTDSESDTDFSGEEYTGSEESDSSEEDQENIMFREELRTVNIDLSKFGENFSASIVSCSGMYNEQIKLFEEVDLCDRRTKKIFPLEKWVANLETVSKRSLLEKIYDQMIALDEIIADMDATEEEHYETALKHLETWLLQVPTQVAAVSRSIMFFHVVERALRGGKTAELVMVRNSITQEIRCTSDMLRNFADNAASKEEALRAYHAASTYILTLLGCKDSVQQFIDKGTQSLGAFEVQAQFRHVLLETNPRSPKKLNVNMGILAKHKYTSGKRGNSAGGGSGIKKKFKPLPMMEKGRRIECRMLGFRRHFSLEYYGIFSRVVVTPLTERCQRAMMTSMRYCVCAMSVGEDGWGKTEIAKDMATLLGTLFLTFKLSNATTMENLRSILASVCANAAWCSIDNFCYVQKGVLALLAEAIGPLQRAALAGASSVNIEGVSSKLKFGWGVHFTSSPQPLRDIGIPPSLRTLLRITKFQAPARSVVLNSLLVANGHSNAQKLAEKVTLFLTRAQLEFPGRKECFGLRHVRLALDECSTRSITHRDSVKHSKDVEFFHALLRKVNVQFDIFDQTRCCEIMDTVMPGLGFGEDDTLQPLDYSIIKNQMENKYLVCGDNHLRTFQGMYECISAGPANMIVVGPAGSGKSTYINFLAQAMSEFERVFVANLVESENGESKKLKEKLRKRPTAEREGTGLSSSSEEEDEEESESDSACDEDNLQYGNVLRGTVNLQYLQPSSVSFDEFFGYFDSEYANKWVAGIFSTMSARFSANKVGFAGLKSVTKYSRKWIVIDSCVCGQTWMEVISACLDESRELLLANGDRVPFTDSMSLVFETDNISNVSPAFLSRCGVVSTKNDVVKDAASNEPLLWEHLITTWIGETQVRILTLRPYVNILQGLFASLLKPCVQFAMKNAASCPENSNHRLQLDQTWVVSSFLRLFECYLKDFKASTSEEVKRELRAAGDNKRVSAAVIEQLEKPKVLSMHADLIISNLQNVFLESLVWTLNPFFSREGQKRLDSFIRELISKFPKKSPEHVQSMAEDWREVKAQSFMKEIPALDIRQEVGLISDHVYNSDTQSWKAFVSNEYAHPIPDHISTVNIFQRGYIIPTTDYARGVASVTKLLLGGNNVVVVGELSSGKQAIVNNALGNLVEEVFSTTKLHFDQGTTANLVRAKIDEGLVTYRKGLRQPASEKRLVVYVDDLSAPEILGVKDGSIRPSHEAMRNLLDKSSWFSMYRGVFEETKIKNVGFVATERQPLSDSKLSLRVVRHFNVVSTDPWDKTKMTHVLSAMTTKFMQRTNHRLSNLAETVMNSAIDLIERCRNEFRPSPQHPHYQYFGLYDAARVTYGVFRVASRSLKYSGPPQKARLFVHEAQRVIEDRMVSMGDVKKFRQVIVQSTVGIFENSLDFGNDREETIVNEDFWPHWFYSALELDRKPCLFTDLVGSDGYIEMTQLAKIQTAINVACELMNEKSEEEGLPPVEIIPFKFTVVHLFRVCRILKDTRDHLCLTGQASTGKHTVLKLAAEMLKLQYVPIDLGKILRDGKKGWRETIKPVLRKAASGERLLLTVNLNSTADYVFRDLYNILKPGTVLEMFDGAELEEIDLRFRDDAIDANTMITSELTTEHVLQYFQDTCCANIKFAMCTSGTRHMFDMWNMYPTLPQLFVTDCFYSWDETTLRYAAEEIFKGSSSARLSKNTISAVADCAIGIHKCVEVAAARNDLAMSQRDFLGMCYLFREFTDNFFDESVETKSKYEFALAKLSETEDEVASMKEEIAGMKPLLDRKIEKADAVMQTVTAERSVVTGHVRAVRDDEAEIERQNKDATAKREFCKEKLREAMPTLNLAIDAIRQLSKKDLEEVKSLRNPPAKVKTVMEAVCIMLGLPPRKVKDPQDKTKKIDDYWASSQAILGNANALKQSLEQYHNHHDIRDNVIQKIEIEYLTLEHFNPEEARKASIACEGLCKWVIGIVKYYRVAQSIKPVKAALKEAEEDVKFSLQVLEQKRKNVKMAEKRLKQLEKQLDRASTEKQKLQAEVKELSGKIKNSTDMIIRLETERRRWEDALMDLNVGNETIPADSLLSAAYVAYCGPFSAEARTGLFQTWGELTTAHELVSTMSNDGDDEDSGDEKNPADLKFAFDPKRILIAEENILEWMSTGLPSDNGCIGSATILENNVKKWQWPLVVDPDGYAMYWMKNYYESDVGPPIIANVSNDAKLRESLRKAVTEGRTIIVDLGTGTAIGEKFIPFLALAGNLEQPTPCEVVVFEGESLNLDLGFKLVFVTKTPLPQGTSCSQPSVLFSLSEDALTEEIMWIMSYDLFPEQSALRQQAIIDNTRLHVRKKQLQNEVLELLNESEGSMMEDERLINVLNDSRRKTMECIGQIKTTNNKRLQNTECIEVFRPLAERAFTLYKVLSRMNLVKKAYSYSLVWFICILLNVIRDDPDLVVKEEENTEGGGGDQSRPNSKSQRKKPRKEKTVERIASAVSLMVHVNTITKADYLAKKEKKTGEAGEEPEGNTGEPADSTGGEDSAKPTVYQLQVLKVKEAIEMLTSRVVKKAGSGVFLEDHVSFLAGISIELLDFSMEQRKLLSTEVSSLSQDALCRMIDEGKDIQMPSFFPYSLEEREKLPVPLTVQTWMTDEQWGRILYVARELPGVFSSLPSNIEKSAPVYAKMWHVIFMSSTPLEEVFPPPWDKTLTLKDKVVLLRAICPQSFDGSVLPSLIAVTLGDDTLDNIFQSLQDVHDMSSMTLPASPILMTLESGGSKDPLQSIEGFYARWQRFYGGPNTATRIFLGDGHKSIVRATEELKRAVSNGNWVILCNCHLEPQWLPKLSAFVHEVLHKKSSDVNPRFRLWMISVVDENFPSYLVQQSIRVAISEIHSIRHTSRGIFQELQAPDFDVDIMYSVSSNDADGPVLQDIFPVGMDKKFDDAIRSAYAEPASSKRKEYFRRLTYGLALFHGVMEQRASYGVLGWEDAFIEADLELAKEVLAIHMRRWEVLCHTREIKVIAETDGPAPPIPPAHLVDPDYNFYEWCAGVIGDVLYGNSLTDPNDYQSVRLILKSIVCEDALRERSLPYKWGMRGESGEPFGIGTMVEAIVPAGKRKKKRKRKNEDPMAGTIASLDRYKQHINRLPISTSGETVGLGPNASQEYARLSLKNTVQNLSAIYSKPETSGTRNNLFSSVLVVQALDELPARLKEQLAIVELESIEAVIVNREVLLLNKLLAHFKNAVHDLDSAVTGATSFTRAHLSALQTLEKGQVPPDWLGDFTYRFTQSGRRRVPLRYWLSHLKCRVDYFNSILGGNTSFLKDIRLGYLLRPVHACQDLLGGEIGNEYKHWGATGQKRAPDDAYVFTGMYMDGAQYRHLNEKEYEAGSSVFFTEIKESAMYSHVASLYVTKNNALVSEDVSSAQPQSDQFTYQCPVYITSDRNRLNGDDGSNKLFSIPLPCCSPEAKALLEAGQAKGTEESKKTALANYLGADDLKRRNVAISCYVHPDEAFVMI
jgi:type IV secretory pathway ATPase VirB11/archaellum biosynthesis ATPase